MPGANMRSRHKIGIIVYHCPTRQSIKPSSRPRTKGCGIELEDGFRGDKEINVGSLSCNSRIMMLLGWFRFS